MGWVLPYKYSTRSALAYHLARKAPDFRNDRDLDGNPSGVHTYHASWHDVVFPLYLNASWVELQSRKPIPSSVSTIDQMAHDFTRLTYAKS